MANPSILIADDSALVLRMIQTMLEEAGFGVVTARDGLEAIEKAVAEDVRLVILDVMMPRMNGYQACRLLKTEPLTRDLPVVILTSRDQAGDRFWGLETGADYYITKDSEPHRILDLVRNILVDKATALFLAQSVCASLYHRERTGEGNHLVIPMLDVGLYFYWPDGMMDYTLVGDDVLGGPRIAAGVTQKDSAGLQIRHGP